MNPFNGLWPALALVPMLGQAQDKYSTRSGQIAFFSETPMENIEAVNNKVTSVFDAATGAVEFLVLVKAFEFEKALMQEHFNENYMESSTFPKAIFKGTVAGSMAEQLRKPGEYEVNISGELTLHGVAHPVQTQGKFVVEPTGMVRAFTTFTIKPEDHGIKIPGTVRNNIAKEIQVKVKVDYTRM
jgi:polyisoprenoid-binding protein YceI